MSLTQQSLRRRHGFSLLELLLALGLFGALLAGGLAMQLRSLSASEDAGRALRATLLAQDYLHRSLMHPRPPASFDSVEGRASLDADRHGCRGDVDCSTEELRAVLLADFRALVTGDAGLRPGSAMEAAPALPDLSYCDEPMPGAIAVAMSWPSRSPTLVATGAPVCNVASADVSQSLRLAIYRPGSS